MNNLASEIHNQARYAEAERLHREVLEIQHRVLGPAHPDTLKGMQGLANAMWGQGRYAEAARLYGQRLRRELEQLLKSSEPEPHFAERGEEGVTRRRRARKQAKPGR